MSGQKHIKTQYPGVYYRESSERMAGKIADRPYEVCYRDAGGKLCWHTVGRHSHGIRPAYADEIRKRLVSTKADPVPAASEQEQPPAPAARGQSGSRSIRQTVRPCLPGMPAASREHARGNGTKAD
jgi:hypothetical protein